MSKSSMILAGAVVLLVPPSAQACDGRRCTEEEIILRSDQVHAPRQINPAARYGQPRYEAPLRVTGPGSQNPYIAHNGRYGPAVLPQGREYGRRGFEYEVGPRDTLGSVAVSGPNYRRDFGDEPSVVRRRGFQVQGYDHRY
jgi:hypothetical protein